MARDINNYEDIMDSRDIVERIEELESEVKPSDESTGEDNEARAELATLQAIVDQIDNYSGDKASDGVTLIRDSYFKDYAQELAEDIGAINKDATWPNTCIDWDQAARELQMDYTSLEFDGVTYWYR